jgi:nicotinamidase-related amidase
MTKTADSLYGSAPDKSPVAVLLIDVINDLSFPESKGMMHEVALMSKRLAQLKEKAAEHNVPVVYVNDNFAKWRSDFKHLVAHCVEDGVPGQEMVRLLKPGEEDYFVLKPAHSGFFSTTLDILLKHLGAQTLILTGIATNICVLFTANDAFLRGYELYVPKDCVAANTPALSKESLHHMKLVLKARIGSSASLPWKRWKLGRKKPKRLPND